jgi:predicted O-linked N-acetylglucosamine transferase (SPINDLY family)
MGVPVVTLAGDRFCSRMGLSLLENVGLPELVARTPDDYVRIAAALAGNLSHLATLRASLRSRMAESPVCDARRAARELERTFRAMWDAWLQGDTVATMTHISGNVSVMRPVWGRRTEK